MIESGEFPVILSSTAVWIVAEPRPEHVAAIAWLNESSPSDFYLLKLEAVQIGESLPAPVFTVIVGPSPEGKAVGDRKKERAELDNLRHAWWERIVAIPGAKLHSHITPGYHPWISTSSGIRGLSFNYVVFQDACGVELYIDRGKGSEAETKATFDELFSFHSDIEKSIPEKVSWQRLEHRRASRVRIDLGGGYRNPEDQWSEIQSGQVTAMNHLYQAIKPYLSRLGSHADVDAEP